MSFTAASRGSSESQGKRLSSLFFSHPPTPKPMGPPWRCVLAPEYHEALQIFCHFGNTPPLSATRSNSCHCLFNFLKNLPHPEGIHSSALQSTLPLSSPFIFGQKKALQSHVNINSSTYNHQLNHSGSKKQGEADETVSPSHTLVRRGISLPSHYSPHISPSIHSFLACCTANLLIH